MRFRAIQQPSSSRGPSPPYLHHVPVRHDFRQTLGHLRAGGAQQHHHARRRLRVQRMEEPVDADARIALPKRIK